MDACGSSGVGVDRIKAATGDVGFARMTNSDLKDFTGQGWCGCWGVRMSVSVVGRGEFVGDGVFKNVFGNAATP